MNLTKAKELIVKAMSVSQGLKFSREVNVDQYLVAGVKVGKLTPEQAAEKCIKSYNEFTSSCFNRLQ